MIVFKSGRAVALSGTGKVRMVDLLISVEKPGQQKLRDRLEVGNAAEESLARILFILRDS